MTSRTTRDLTSPVMVVALILLASTASSVPAVPSGHISDSHLSKDSPAEAAARSLVTRAEEELLRLRSELAFAEWQFREDLGDGGGEQRRTEAQVRRRLEKYY